MSEEQQHVLEDFFIRMGGEDEHQSWSLPNINTMKLLAVLSLVAICAVSADHGFTYSAYAPLTSAFTPYYMPQAVPYAYAYTGPAPMMPAPAPVMTPIAAVVKTQYHMQDELGQASYGFSEPHHAQSVVQDAAGNKVGSFSFINADGKLVQTNYVADAMGYRVESNDLPVAPMDLPVPVQDTPEVTEAKAKFFKTFEETKSRARRSVLVQTPASTVPLTSAVPTTPLATRTIIPYTTSMSYSNIPLAYSATPYSYGYPYYSGHLYNM